jgi:hypothetical protein
MVPYKNLKQRRKVALWDVTLLDHFTATPRPSHGASSV